MHECHCADGAMLCCRTRLGPNEVDVKDLESFPNASKKDAAAPPIQEVAKPGPKQVRPED